MAEKLKITLVKSPIGAIPKQKATVAALGLNKTGKTVEQPDNAVFSCHHLSIRFLRQTDSRVDNSVQDVNHQHQDNVHDTVDKCQRNRHVVIVGLNRCNH